jgi:hypothetical protein
LYSCTIGDSLIRVDAAVRFLAIEELFQEFSDLGDSSRTSNKDDFVDLALVHASIVKYLLNRLECLLEEVSTEVFKLGSGESLFEVDAINDILNCHFNLQHS